MEGGLGLRRLEEVNKVSMLKLIWRVAANKPSLWVDWVKRELIRTCSLWSEQVRQTTGSWMWRKMLKYRELARGFHRVEIHDGNSTSFWHDAWCRLGPLFNCLQARGFIDLGIGTAATVAEGVLSMCRRRRRTQIQHQVISEVKNLRERGLHQRQDEGLWRRANGSFTNRFITSETWEQTRRRKPRSNAWKVIWITSAAPKYAFFSWLAVHDRLSTGDKMATWRRGIDTLCVLCPSTYETRNHLFFECPFSYELWKSLMQGLLGSQLTGNWDTIQHQLSGTTMHGTDLFLLRYAFQVTVHTLWNERNRRRHGEQHQSVLTLARNIDLNVRNKLSLLARKENPLINGLQRWFATRV